MQHQPNPMPRPLTVTSPDVLVLRRLTPEERRELRDRGVCVRAGAGAGAGASAIHSDDEEA